jgi:[acyl-carrier-protein] S-malonyltransferase
MPAARTAAVPAGKSKGTLQNMKIGLMFAGQGAQAVGMGKDLYGASSAAREVFRRADEILGWSVSGCCFEGPVEELTLSRNCQPAIYTMSTACLAALGERMPLEPLACGGLSLGEFAALQAAGVLPLEDGLRLVAERGALMGRACKEHVGAMAAVLNAEAATVEDICGQAGIDVANYNCPGQVVISGESTGVEEAIGKLRQAGVSRIVPLQVDGAFHSRLMASAAAAFAPLLDGLELSPPRCMVVQNFPGEAVSDPARIKANLAAQITGSVRWEQCVRTMLDAGVEALVELGPGKALSGFIKRIDRRFPVYNVGDVDSLENTLSAIAN